jgi:hypothetical protein
MAFLLRQFKTLNNEAHTRALARTSSELTAVARGNLNHLNGQLAGRWLMTRKKVLWTKQPGQKN